MKLNRVNSAIDRNERNKINENFDILERGYGKAAIDAQYAVETSDEAKQKAESTQMQLNTIVIEGDSSVEAAQARVDTENIAHETLKGRIDNDVIKITRKFDEEIGVVTRQLAHTTQQVTQKAPLTEIERLDTEKATKTEVILKADKIYVDGLLSGITDGSPRDIFYSITALTAAYPTGAIGTYLVFDSSFTDGAHVFVWSSSEAVWKDGGLYQAEGIADKSITPQKISFASVVGNLFNKEDIKKDGYFASNGQWVSSTEFNSSSYIEIKPNTKYITNVTTIFSHVVFFDANRVFVSAIVGGSWSGVINVPDELSIKYMTFAFYKAENLNNLMLLEGEVLPTEYVPFKIVFDEYVELSDGIMQQVVKNDDIKTTTGRNLYDYASVKIGKEIGTNSIERANELSAVTDFIELNNGHSTLSVSGLTAYTDGYNRLYSFYDENKQPLITDISAQSISRTTTTSVIAIPENASYFRLNIYSNKTSTEIVDFKTIQVEHGALATPVQPFTKVIDSINGQKIYSALNGLKTNDLSLLIFGDSIAETANVSDDGATYNEGIRKNWPTYTQATLNFKEMWNYAKFGASYKYRELAGDVTSVRQRITHQVQTAIDNNRHADVIIFAAGTNDGTTNMGTYNDAMAKTTLESLDKTQLYEALRWCFWTIQIHYPNALKFVSLPIQRREYEPPQSLMTAIRTMAERYGFIVINMTTESQIIREFELTEPGRDLEGDDGLHPVESGMIKMAKVMNRHILNNLNDGF